MSLLPSGRIPMVAFTWRGPAAAPQVVNAGPLALIEPLLDRLDLEAVIDRHLPPDPQQEFSHGQVLRVLLAARLCQPTALVNVAAWAARSGADIFANIPADKLNDDRLGRALDAFFDHRHSVLGSVTAQAARLTGLSLNRLHFDPTAILLCGAYDTSEPRPDWPADVPFTGERRRGHRANFLSGEQRRRRDSTSSWPKEHCELAALRHTLRAPADGQEIDARLIFVYSTADAGAARQRRQENIAKIQAGLTALQVKLQRGHPQCTVASITRQVVRLLGHKGAARYFTWQLLPLTPPEHAALPPPARGHRPPTHPLELHFHPAAAEADQAHDGLAVLVTTAASTQSADLLFSQFKQQNYVELLHHQWTAPLAASPVFLHSPPRVEALACLLQIALQSDQVLERLYRQSTPPEAAVSERRLTTERLLRIFSVYGLLVSRTAHGRVVHTTRLSNRQRQILDRLHFPTPAQRLNRILRPEPSG